MSLGYAFAQMLIRRTVFSSQRVPAFKLYNLEMPASLKNYSSPLAVASTCASTPFATQILMLDGDAAP
jgi:hypothetical protein